MFIQQPPVISNSSRVVIVVEQHHPLLCIYKPFQKNPQHQQSSIWYLGIVWQLQPQYVRLSRMRLCAEEAVPSCRVKSPSAPSRGHSKVWAFNSAANLPKVRTAFCSWFCIIQDSEVSSMSVQLLIHDTECLRKTSWRNLCFPSRKKGLLKGGKKQK